MATDPTERGRLLELLAQVDALIDGIAAGNERAANEGHALLVKAQDLRVTIKTAIEARS